MTFVLEGSLGAHRNELIAVLKEAGIGTSVYYPHPVPRLRYYAEKYGYDLVDHKLELYGVKKNPS